MRARSTPPTLTEDPEVTWEWEYPKQCAICTGGQYLRAMQAHEHLKTLRIAFKWYTGPDPVISSQRWIYSTIAPSCKSLVEVEFEVSESGDSGWVATKSIWFYKESSQESTWKMSIESCM